MQSSALDFYPVAPGSGQFALGSPVIKTATLKFENGRMLSIEARNQSEKNVYVTRVTLNGRRLDRRYITYSELTAGGTLVLQMSRNREIALNQVRTGAK